MTALRLSPCRRGTDCGELFDADGHSQCWRETAAIDEHGSPVEQPVCRDCLREEWLHRNSIAPFDKRSGVDR